jgi:hypothetical protein
MQQNTEIDIADMGEANICWKNDCASIFSRKTTINRYRGSKETP